MFKVKLTVRHLLGVTALLAVYFAALVTATRGNLIGVGVVVMLPLLVLTLLIYALVYWLAFGLGWGTTRFGRRPAPVQSVDRGVSGFESPGRETSAREHDRRTSSPSTEERSIDVAESKESIGGSEPPKGELDV